MTKLSSVFKTQLELFLKTKEHNSEGYQKKYFKYLNDFDSYADNLCVNKPVLTEFLVMGWYPQRTSESIDIWKHRLVPLRQFASWTLLKGMKSFMVPSTGNIILHTSTSLKGPFSSRIIQFLESYKPSSVKADQYFTSLAYFDRYCQSKFPNSNQELKLNREIVTDWYEKLIGEHCNQLKYRMVALRNFAYWLIEHGESAYIAPNLKKHKEQQVKSIVGPLGKKIQEFIDFKHSSGFSYKTASTVLYNFERFCIKNNFNDTIVTKKLMDAWSIQRITEGINSKINRIQIVNSFSVHLQRLGYDSYVRSCKGSKNKKLVHILSDEELKSLFLEIDVLRKGRTWMKYTYPVILRLIYCCGLRIDEACHIRINDWDHDNNKVTIIGGKNKKDREIYLADDVNLMMQEYNKKIANYFPTRIWFFQGSNAHSHIAHFSVRKVFNEAWERTPYSNKVEKKPTVHCLRSTFVVNTVRRWMEEGKDVNTLYPYLSKYLGHKGINETQWYLQFVVYHYPLVLKKLEFTNSIIPELYNE
jgi:integrase